MEPDVTFLLNEEGKLKGLPANRHYRGDILVGPVLVCGVKGEHFCSLREDQMAKYEQMFQEPETFTPREQFGLAFYAIEQTLLLLSMFADNSFLAMYLHQMLKLSFAGMFLPFAPVEADLEI